VNHGEKRQVTGATLIIAKLDRLSRDAAFLLTLRDSGGRFVACDMHEAKDLTVGIMALVAQAEREEISRRTKEDLRTPRGLDRSVMAHLSDGGWIARHENLLITGPTGLGKSWIACALGHKACGNPISRSKE
jgi:hypothetical protein